MKQSEKEKRNEFRCLNCDELWLRGTSEVTTRGPYKGYVAKVCHHADCKKAVRTGRAWDQFIARWFGGEPKG